MWEYMNGGMGFGMGLGMLIFWGLLIAGIVMVVRCFGSPDSCGKGERGKSALDILKERYARGEIEKEEFEQKKRDLEN